MHKLTRPARTESLVQVKAKSRAAAELMSALAVIRRAGVLPIRYSFLQKFDRYDRIYDLTIEVGTDDSPPIPGWMVLDTGIGLRVMFRLDR
jgi:hypothetical protein